jgi:hypothetical protein
MDDAHMYGGLGAAVTRRIQHHNKMAGYAFANPPYALLPFAFLNAASHSSNSKDQGIREGLGYKSMNRLPPDPWRTSATN